MSRQRDQVSVEILADLRRGPGVAWVEVVRASPDPPNARKRPHPPEGERGRVGCCGRVR